MKKITDKANDPEFEEEWCELEAEYVATETIISAEFPDKRILAHQFLRSLAG